MALTLSNVSSQYGAPMGRAVYGAPVDGELCGLRAIPLNAGGYDSGGAYWGRGPTLYRLTFEAGTQYLRAASRFDAWQQACGLYRVQIRVKLCPGS
jgi:hypothetical protein